MRLSELSTDKALDVLCELTPHIASIIEDEQIVSGMNAIMPEKREEKEEPNYLTTGIQMFGGIAKLAPVLLKTHRDNVYGILSALNEKTVEEIAAQSVKDTICQLREVFQDNELLNFFKSFMQRVRTEPSVPSVDYPDSE